MSDLGILSGYLIEMNVHTYTKDIAKLLEFLGVSAFIIAGACLISYLFLVGDIKKYIKNIILDLVIMALAVGIFAYGWNMPKYRIISCCANGPVSIEQIAASYDIEKIDGKLIELRER